MTSPESFAQRAASAATATVSNLFASQSMSPISPGNARNLQGFCPPPLLVASPDNTNFIDANLISPGLGQLFSCAFRCEGTMFDQNDIDQYSNAQTLVSGIGLLTSLFVFLTWGVFPVKAKQKMTFWIAFASVMVTSLVFWPSIFKGSGSEVWCKDALEPRRQTDGPSSCVAQGFAIIFFGLVLACWWWCSCFDLFCKLYLRKRDIQHYVTYYHILSWTLPGVCALIILCTQKYGYEQPRLWCFLAPEAPSSFEYVFFYGWVGALWISGDIMMFLVVWSLIAHSRSFKKRNPTTNYFKKLSMYKTPLFFVFIFSFFWAVFFTFVVLTDVQTSDFEDSAGTWIACLLLTVALSGGNLTDPANVALPQLVAILDPQPKQPQAGCGDVQPGRISIGLMWATVLMLAGNGILIYIVFGLQGENYSLWVNFIASGFSKEAIAVNKGGENQLSTFDELRRGIARWNIKLCQLFAGDSMADVLTGKDLLRKSNVKNPDRPIVSGEDNSIYTAKYVDNYPVSPLGSPAVTSFPRASYQKETQDPFPTRSSQQPVSLSQFYRNSNANEAVNNNNQAPPPNNRGRQETENQRGGRQTQYTVGGWSDIYNDPLWGVNVEF